MDVRASLEKEAVLRGAGWAFKVVRQFLPICMAVHPLSFQGLTARPVAATPVDVQTTLARHRVF
jgi:hypothetical protein